MLINLKISNVRFKYVSIRVLSTLEKYLKYRIIFKLHQLYFREIVNTYSLKNLQESSITVETLNWCFPPKTIMSVFEPSVSHSPGD